MEEWRLWVFLVLNLLLLAIFFTSVKPSTSSQNQEGEKSDDDGEMRIARRKKKTKQSQGNSEGDETCVYEDHFKLFVEKRSHETEQRKEVKEEKVEDLEESGKLSKEELNERVEAFIATFRLHLFLDSRKGRASSVRARSRVVF